MKEFSTVYQDENGLKIEAENHAPGHFYQTQIQGSTHHLWFQYGPIPLVGVNGLTSESLLIVLIDRTKKLDSLFPCDENKQAIAHMEKALKAFNDRTANRKARNVEGTYQV